MQRLTSLIFGLVVTLTAFIYVVISAVPAIVNGLAPSGKRDGERPALIAVGGTPPAMAAIE